MRQPEEKKSATDAQRRGLVLVYTGNGKGKTTASLGLALRAIGHGSRVFVLQFMKGPGNVYGEYMAAEKYLPMLTIVRSGRDDFVDKLNPAEEDVRLARQGLDLARKVISGGEYGLVILDEINVAVDYRLVALTDVVELLKARPSHVDVVLTGRYAAPEILEMADLVSEVNEVKHHYRKGVPARQGVEY
ncbi:MAG: cob(I)yrinic acid a,c-diamide adenosyltransferase [Firmicutes bacterium]|nr:cob(I)yrinic acid a,c-diamide adenosyltransferase [Bacillota bacterium]